MVRRNPGRFTSTNWWYKEVKDDGTDLTTPDTWKRGLIRVSNQYTFTAGAEQNVSDENGKEYRLSSAKGSSSLSMSALRGKTKELMDIAVDGRGKFYQLVLELNESSANGVFEYMVIPSAKITGNTQISQGSEVTIEWIFNDMTASRTIALTNANLAGAAATFSATNAVIGVDKSFAIVEVAG